MKLILSFILLLLFIVNGYSQISKLKGDLSLSSLKVKGENIELIVDKPRFKQITIRFLAKNAYFIQSSCNLMHGKYTATGKATFKFKPGTITAMHCGDKSNQMDITLSRMLSKITSYQIKNKTLTLQDKSGSNVLIFR